MHFLLLCEEKSHLCFQRVPVGRVPAALPLQHGVQCDVRPEHGGAAQADQGGDEVL